MTQSDQLRLAVFIDFDNIEIGVKNTLNASFDVGLVLDALKERGDVVSKLAYSDWQRAGGYSRALTQHAIRMVQRNMTPGGDKNGADINLALDALEMAFTHPHINAFAIVGGDSDFISLVEKLKQYDKKVFVVGGRQFTSAIMQRNCHQFIAYENLVATGGGRRASGGRASTKTDGQSLESVAPLVRRALEVLSERDVLPQLGLLKSTLLQLDSTFSERSYGAGSFREFAQKLEKAGVLRVQQGKGGWIVAPAGAAAGQGEPAATSDGEAAEAEAAGGDPGRAAGGGERAAGGDRGAGGGDRGPAPARLGQPADGVRELGAILGAATIRRWPLYLRNLKQILRQTQPSFDERAYGFANLSDLARAAHRAGLLRIERDRQGNIRMFEGKVPPAELPEADARAAVGPEGDEAPAPADPADVAEAADAAAPPSDAGGDRDADDPDHEPGDVNGNRVGGPSSMPAGAKKAPARRRTVSRTTAGGTAGTKKRAPRPRAKKKPA